TGYHPRDRRGRQAERQERDDRARHAGHPVADQARDEHVRARLDLRQGDERHEVGRRRPAVHVDGVALHFGDDGPQAAKREKRQQRKIQPELDQNHSLPLDEKRIPTVSAIAIRTTNDTRAIATRMKHPAIKATGAGLRAIGRPSFIAVAMNNPAPAAPAPVTTADTSGCATQCVYKTASVRTHRYGSAKRPKNATIAPRRPNQRLPSTIAALPMFGPGRIWHNAHTSVKSAGVSQRRFSTMTSDPARKAAARPRIARSPPGQGMPNPSTIQNVPKLARRTPTVNFNVFSGTRASGRRSARAASVTTSVAPTAPRLAGRIVWLAAPAARTMKTTSTPSRRTALKLAISATRSQRREVVAVDMRSVAVVLANARCSSRRGMTPPALMTALRSQLSPNSRSSTPMTTWSKETGMVERAGPRRPTRPARTATPASVPASADLQPRTVPTASTIVAASTHSTNEPRN